jgi:hypothetical protein
MKKSSIDQSLLFLDEVVLWGYAVAVGYWLILPCCALGSLVLAESLLQLTVLHQGLLLVLAPLGLLSLANGFLGHRNRWLAYLGGLGWLLVLFAISNSASCCSAVIAWAAGMLPTSELHWSEALGHTLPVVGALFVILSVFQGNSLRRQQARAAKPAR